jgi:hypothetical protein
MKGTVEMGSGALIYVLSFVKIGCGIKKLMGRGDTHRQQGDLINLLLFFQSKESSLKTENNKFTSKRLTQIAYMTYGESWRHGCYLSSRIITSSLASYPIFNKK